MWGDGVNLVDYLLRGNRPQPAEQPDRDQMQQSDQHSPRSCHVHVLSRIRRSRQVRPVSAWHTVAMSAIAVGGTTWTIMHPFPLRHLRFTPIRHPTSM
jgi:hypothetical protein